MAEVKSAVDVMERQWVVKSLRLQCQALIRSRQREIPGSEIYVLRTKEIELLNGYILKYGG